MIRSKKIFKKLPIQYLFFCFLFLLSLPVYSTLNDTGVGFCTNLDIPCPNEEYPGQDGDTGRDVIFNDDSNGHVGFDFSKVDGEGNVLPNEVEDWDCVLDNTTGLTWETKTDNGLRKESHRYIWYNPDNSTNGGYTGDSNGGQYTTKHYIDELNRIQLCGYQDWRLPTIQELQSIVSFQPVRQRYESSFPGFYLNQTIALDLRYFPRGWSCGEQNEGYITSSLYLPVSSSLPMAKSISYVSGTEGIQALPVIKLGIGQCLRLVRGGLETEPSTQLQANVAGQTCVTNIRHTTPTQQFIDNEDGTVTDRHTQLTWMRCRLGQNWDQELQACTNEVNFYTWQEALVAAEQLEFAGKSQWRLPNIKELNSIVANSCISPSINTEVFLSWYGRTESASYIWSSTPFYSFANTVFYINFATANLGLQSINSNNNFGTILVHDAVEDDSDEPDTDEPDTNEPDTDEPDTDEPDTNEPDTNEPDTNEPDTNEPDTNEPDTDEPDTDEPDTDEPDTDEPDTNEPDTNEPDTNEPNTNEPDTNEPDTDESDTDEPGTDEPGTNEPDTDELDTDEPDTDEPDTDEPDTDEPDTDELDTDELKTEEIKTDDSNTDASSSGGALDFIFLLLFGVIFLRYKKSYFYKVLERSYFTLEDKKNIDVIHPYAEDK